MDYNVGKFEPIYGSGVDSHFLQRGGIYFLEDRFASGIFTNITNQSYKKSKDGDCGNITHHPYIVISDYYNTNQQFVFCVSIDSKPYVSNMVPFIYNDNIAYINPLAVCQYPRNKIRYYNFRAFISNPEVMEIVSNLLGMSLGMSLSKSKDEILLQYSQYIDQFEKKSRNFCHYQSKDPSTIKFTSDIISDDNETIEIEFGSLGPNDVDESNEKDESLKEDHLKVISENASESSASSNCKKSRKRRYTEEDWKTVVKMYGRNEVSRKDAPDLLGISRYTFDVRLRLINVSDLLTDEDLKVSRENAIKISKLPEKERIYYYAYDKRRYKNGKLIHDSAFESVYKKVESGELKPTEAARILGISEPEYYRRREAYIYSHSVRESDYKRITKNTIPNDLIINMESDEIKSDIHRIDSTDDGFFNIDNGYNSMSEYEMKLFLAYVKQRGSQKAAIKFATKKSIVESTIEAISNSRNVIYA